MACFPTPPLFDATARGNPLEFLDETYSAKSKGMGLPCGEKIVDTHSTSLKQPTQIFTFAHSIVKHIGICGFRRPENNRLYRFFRLFLVGIRYFPVFKIPKSVSVSVFKNIRYRFGFSVNRPTSTPK